MVAICLGLNVLTGLVFMELQNDLIYSRVFCCKSHLWWGIFGSDKYLTTQQNIKWANADLGPRR